MTLIPVIERTKSGIRRYHVVANLQRKTFSGRGRPRPPTKDGVARYPGGQIRHAERGEKEEEVLETAVAARVRHLKVDRKEARSAKLGTALGRLTISAVISPANYTAGERIALVMSRAAILDDVPPPFGTPVLARLAMTSGRDPYEAYNPDTAWDVTQERERREAIKKVRADHAELTTAVWEMEARPETKGAWSVIQRVCLWDDEKAAFGNQNSGLLRCGLNQFVRLWQIREAR